MDTRGSPDTSQGERPIATTAPTPARPAHGTDGNMDSVDDSQLLPSLEGSSHDGPNTDWIRAHSRPDTTMRSPSLDASRSMPPSSADVNAALSTSHFGHLRDPSQEATRIANEAISSIPPSFIDAHSTNPFGHHPPPPSFLRLNSNPGPSSSLRPERSLDPDHHWLSEDEGISQASASASAPSPPMLAKGLMSSNGGGGGAVKSDGRRTATRRRIPRPSSASPSRGVRAASASTTITPDSDLSATLRSSRSSPSPPLFPPPQITAEQTFLKTVTLQLTCKSCNHLLRDPTTLPCGHTVCLSCHSSNQHRPSLQRPTIVSLSSRSLPTLESLGEKATKSTILSSSPTAPSALMMHRSGSSSSARTTATATSGGASRIPCPVPECRHKDGRSGVIVGGGVGGVVGEHRVDYVLKKIVDIVRSQPAWDEEGYFESGLAGSAFIVGEGDSDDGDGEEDFEDAEEGEAEDVNADACTHHSSGSASSGGGGEDPVSADDSKRVHRMKEWASSKRVRRIDRSAIDLSTDVDDAALKVSPSIITDVQSELECQVCVQLFYQPITSPCGHTFCQRCLARALDHSDKCPLCRSDFPSYAYFQHQPHNQTTQDLLLATFPSLIAERKESIEADEKSVILDTPIFVCTLAWPNLPTYIHIFEPRYRLMLRRVMDGDRQFGMVLPSRNDGVHDYGTMLQVRSCEMIEDGRSIVETMGTFRFRLLEKGTFDGYTVGRIERVDDISEEQEATLEQAALARNPPGVEARSPIFPPSAPGTSQMPAQTAVELSTPQLMNVCLEFVQTLRSGSAPWVLQRLNNTIGPMPSNPSDFSFWMAEVMPVDDHVKATLLQITSPRERLRLLVFWIEQFRSSWWFSRGCSIM